MEKLKMLFSPVKIGGMELKNRIVMAPMLAMWGTTEGAVSQRLIDYYEARARGGTGLIILGDTSVDILTPYSPHGIGLWEDGFIPGLGELVKAVHAHGAKVIPQVVYRGPNTYFLHDIQPVGPSPVLSKITGQRCRELDLEEIELVIEQFGDAARRAREAGFDGIGLHAAHAYHLVGSFMSPLRNKRSDAYGGSVDGRLKLFLDIVRNIRAKAGDDFPIVTRVSGDELLPGGQHIQDMLYIAPIMAEAGVAALNISAGAIPELGWRVIPPTGSAHGINVPLSAALKQVTNVPVIAVGRIYDPRLAEYILQRNEADLVAMGRALLADPEWPNKAAEGRIEDIVPCVGCSRCSFVQEPTCVVNASLGKEKEMVITPAAKPRKVLIAGGGPGGLEAARVAALRGHHVSLFEKEAKLGGQLELAAMPPFKQELCHVVKYLSMQAQKAGVTVELNTRVTTELIEKVKPDVVIVATGGHPFVPDLPGVENKHVVTAHDVLAGAAALRFKNAVVIGGSAVGCEIADFLTDQGDPVSGGLAVSIVTGQPDIGADIPAGPRALLMQRLREKGVKKIVSATVKEILDDGIVISRDGQDEIIRNIDCVVLARGVRSVDELSGSIRGKTAEVYVIGDAREPRTAKEAIREGAEVARKI